MSDADPFETQRDVVVPLAVELDAAGFENAEEIGRGGFGVVYRCRESELDRTVAVKVLLAHSDEDNEQRFFREQRAMGRLTGHPHIVTALHTGTTGSGHPYLVMPYHRQDSLDAMIRRRGPLSVEQGLTLGIKLAGALATAHRFGIVHRDIKPTNILLTDYGEPALTDFGIAHVSGAFETATGIITGSPAYTAPEVLAGRAPTPVSDVYGLGATLFSAVTGHAAFERRSGEQLVAQFLRITTAPIPDPREHGIPDDFSSVIERTMSAAPQDRPSAVELGEELQQIEARLGFATTEMVLYPDSDTAPGLHTRPRQSGPRAAPSADVVDGNLPAELTSFVGRRRELTAAGNLLRKFRLVTLTGMGGTGKTRLALRVAAHEHREYRDGVWLVELGELRDQSLLSDIVAAALGLRDQSARPAADTLVDYLRPRELLLVLDNCEHVVRDVAQLAGHLLQTCRSLRILATSREALAIDGEAVLRLPPLSLPDTERMTSVRDLDGFDAITLFIERAKVAVPDFTVTESNTAAIVGICQRLDGLPLPIELAAARIRALSPDQILDRLTDRYTLLTGGARTAPTRQQTLRLCIDWSYDLCTALERAVWARLSVFAGSFTLDAAETVCGYDMNDSDLLDVMTSLLDKSIVIREESGPVVRFRLLETIRSYGRLKTEEVGNHDELLIRHRDWCRDLAADAETNWISARQLDWIARLDREQPNLRAALNLCVSSSPEVGLRIANALFEFWNARSMFGEGRYWFDRLLNAHDGQPGRERAKALFANTQLANMQGDRPTAQNLVRQGRILTDRVNDPTISSYVTLAEGMHAMFTGDLPQACEDLERAAGFFTEEIDLSARVEALMMLGLAYTWQGDTAHAISKFDDVLTITRTRGESVLQGYALWAIGLALWRQHSTHDAIARLKESLRLAHSAVDQVGVTACLEALAWIAAEQDDGHRAAILLGAADALSRAVGSSSVYLPNLLDDHDACERSTRRILDPQAFTVALREGEALTFDEAVAYALDEEPESDK
ncbi:protein kinase [Rhodococcus sp. NPDC056960]|uniref:protein kinase domain-containing protein n=1 Tax=Rhodococcus sp. NPDC056960 TaxID=3345982 RepID=UPI003639FB83